MQVEAEDHRRELQAAGDGRVVHARRRSPLGRLCRTMSPVVPGVRTAGVRTAVAKTSGIDTGQRAS